MNTLTEMDEHDVLRVKLEVLRQEHRDLDDAIAALQERGASDMLTIKRLKKQKLYLKDQIAGCQPCWPVETRRHWLIPGRAGVLPVDDLGHGPHRRHHLVL